MRRGAALALLMLAGCHHPPAPGRSDTPGDRLEHAAMVQGLVPDPERINPVGLYAREGDRVCVVPAGRHYRVGALVVVDEKATCAAGGEARGSGGRLDVRFGDDCRFRVSLDGDRISLPATLPAACDRYCTGRASLSALAADRLSDSAAEAAALRDGRGRALCGQ